MKEQLFTAEHEKHQTHLLRRELELMSQKLSAKMERVKKLERRFNELSKIKDSISTVTDS